MGQAITAGKLVELKYTMHGPDGSVLDSTGEGTESYVHGLGAIPAGLEAALFARHAGDRFEVVVSPSQGFGPRQVGVGAQPVPRATFPPDAPLSVGMKFEAETPDGQPMHLFITRVEEREVFVDANHPFAGLTLRFVVEVVSVSEPP